MRASGARGSPLRPAGAASSGERTSWAGTNLWRALLRLVLVWPAALVGCADEGGAGWRGDAAAAGASTHASGGAPAAEAVVIGFVGDTSATAASALRGVRVGVAEAAHAGRLVGRSLSLLRVETASPRGARAAARRLVGRGAVALVGGFDERSCREIAAVAERERVVFLNVACRSDALRRSTSAGALHVEASDSMYREASAGATAGDTAVLWHPGLARYGAVQLNDRLVRAGVEPDGPAWAGWMAVKAVWEGLLDAPRSSRPRLEEALTSAPAAFDGHKGEPLRFDPGTGQLVQPVYAVSRAGMRRARAGSGYGARPADVPPVPVSGGVYAFVSNEGSADVSVIDLAAHREISRIPIGARPRGIQASPDGRRILVALSDDAPAAESDRDAIAVIDLASGAVVGRYGAGSDPEQFAISPDGRRLYSANEDAGTASVTGVAAGEVLATLIVGIEPEGVAVSPDGRWVYIAAETSNTVSVIDTRVNEVVASFLVDARPRGVAFSPGGGRAYVTNEIAGTVSVIDVAAHRVVASIPLDPDGLAKPVGVVVSPDGGRIYVANGHGNSVAVIDAGADRVVGRIPVGRRPWGIAISPDGARVYTANGGSDDLSVIDTASGRVVATIVVGSRPWGVAVAEVPAAR